MNILLEIAMAVACTILASCIVIVCGTLCAYTVLFIMESVCKLMRWPR